jgi:hypothetical protein
VGQHRDVLQRARASLASAWPPERSPAAARFFEHLDNLIASMGEMQDVAVTNHGALSGVLTSLQQARTTVDDLHVQWKAAAPAGRGLQQRPTMMTEGQKTLNEQAQQHMVTADNAVSDHGSHMAAPPSVQPSRIH